jgi:pyruvate kinase
LRRLDLRELQHRLMGLGLSSIGRCEGRVLTTLDAIHWALTRMLARGRATRRRSGSSSAASSDCGKTPPSCSGRRMTAASGASW